MTSIPEALRIAVGLHQSNRFQEAAEIYGKILEADPSVADAWHLLGVLHHQAGDHARAVDLIGTAIARDPFCAAYYDNLGAAWRANGQAERAAACHRRAVALDPAWAKAYGNLGAVLLDANRAEAATAALRRALRLAPDQESLLLRLGDCLLSQGKAADAELVYQRLGNGDPNHPAHLYRLGVCKLSISGLLSANPLNSRHMVDPITMRDAIAHFLRAAQGGHAEALKNSFGTIILALQNGVLDDSTLAETAQFARLVLKRNPRHTAALAVVCYDLYRQKRMGVACRFFRKHARLFSPEEVASDFELLVWSLVQSDPRFYDRLGGFSSRLFGAAVRRTLAPPANDGRPILLAGCDDVYWRRFGSDFVASFRERAGSCVLHVHVVNPSAETLDALKRLSDASGGRLSCSCEAIDLSHLSDPVRLTYFASARFAVARDLIRDGKGPVVQVDIDARFLEDPGAAVGAWPSWDIAIMKDRRHRGPTRDFLAGFMAFNRTPRAAAFLDMAVSYIGWHFDEGRAYWGLDQAAPYCIHDWLDRSGTPPAVVWFDFENFPFLEFLAK
ncbi:tetratricopeptide repeat protein [Azospirillum rugosum]|uniref:Tfp pilus assembly protein PilF n=1 Tax=Azospirillum rugosum TaxID=416170 RepID=A0ABS4SRX9_9PROT|nr:tetratricopeptide repeat protein [Azospirillum rugosum]MBP2294979.1 Tfp pilus assembly protein PilF [Azospirillum rugosum]MDQ0528802.1 Tfp pilus assembly protein PilF [Azospirillum rugosum]